MSYSLFERRTTQFTITNIGNHWFIKWSNYRALKYQLKNKVKVIKKIKVTDETRTHTHTLEAIKAKYDHQTRSQ